MYEFIVSVPYCTSRFLIYNSAINMAIVRIHRFVLYNIGSLVLTYAANQFYNWTNNFRANRHEYLLDYKALSLHRYVLKINSRKHFLIFLTIVAGRRLKDVDNLIYYCPDRISYVGLF